MNIKQTIKTSIISLAALVGFTSLVATPSYAATCGGVTTSIISCSQTGSCPSGEDPFEGTKPTDPASIKAYTDKYKHDYGKCIGGSDPSASVESSGVWGLLLMIINILTAGVGVLAVGGIVYGAILYTSAGGSPEGIKKARGIITNVVIGVLAYALMFALLNFIIPGGLLKP